MKLCARNRLKGHIAADSLMVGTNLIAPRSWKH